MHYKGTIMYNKLKFINSNLFVYILTYTSLKKKHYNMLEYNYYLQT